MFMSEWKWLRDILMVPSFILLSFVLSVSGKEKPDKLNTHTHTHTHTKEFVDMKYSLSRKASTELSRQTNPKSRNLWLRKIIKDTQVINQWLKQFTRSIYEVVVIAWSRVQYGKYLPYFAKNKNSKIWETRKMFVNIEPGNVP